jgi:hypothetical protein
MSYVLASFNILTPTGYVMHQPTGYVMHRQFNIQQLYALPTLYLCVLYLSENKQRLVQFTEMESVYSAVRTGSLNEAVCASSLKG